MKSKVEKIKEENRSLRKELEQVKNKINKSSVNGKKRNEEQTPKNLNKSKDKDKRRKETGRKNGRNSKRKSRASALGKCSHPQQKEERIAEERIEENSIIHQIVEKWSVMN